MLTFGSDLTNYYHNHGLKVFTPRCDALERIVNYRDPRTHADAATAMVSVGAVRYASSHRAFQQVDGLAVSMTPTDLLGQKTALFGMTRTGTSNTTKIGSRPSSNCAGNQRRCASGKSYSIRMASMRTRTPRTRENGRRDVAKVAPDQPKTSGFLRAIIDTEPLPTLHRRATRSARRAFVQSVRNASAG